MNPEIPFSLRLSPNRQLVALRLPYGLATFIYLYKLGLAQSIALARPGGLVPDPLLIAADP